LQYQRLLIIPFNEFEQIINQAFIAIGKLDLEYQEMLTIIRDRKKKILGTVQNKFQRNFEERLDQIQKLRSGHEKLIAEIDQMDENTGLEISDLYNANKEIGIAYDSIKNIDCLQLTKEGEKLWDQAVHVYDEKIHEIKDKYSSEFFNYMDLEMPTTTEKTGKRTTELYLLYDKKALGKF
jgi:dynein heavy chain 1